MANIDDLAKSR